ncbi:hypothetical protein FGE12_14015 [Aggregicoccus sp. 17bor-14]|uniref:hypothetical protein n=1 Tax=Myxococcaceae TaxID=31 RepID=UPI00129C504B|nr:MULTISPECIES: hypothetical protein [Myxococcaceae]MBF5043510.1 hypothetical protein [Simulacricoccus sp. 17bor-14]MRI89267.1 hypothetical protein [Aggregicoccus sp. 17bor-14]
MLTADHQAGRLVEARGEGLITYPEFVAFRSSFMEKLARAGVRGPVIAVGDLRKVERITDDAQPAVLGLLRSDNARVERSAHLLTARTPFAQLYADLIEKTHNASRRAFTDPWALIDYLAPVLTPAEMQRLEAMLR